jgi:hypothetical protein
MFIYISQNNKYSVPIMHCTIHSILLTKILWLGAQDSSVLKYYMSLYLYTDCLQISVRLTKKSNKIFYTLSNIM